MTFYYFAYGSNMNHKEMRKRCPGSRFKKAVYLKNAEFRYDGQSKTRGNKAVANIVDANGQEVWGGLFEVTQGDLDKLDCCEGYPKSYDRKIVKVRDTEGKDYDAWVYFRIGEKKGEPSDEYRTIVLEGVKDCKLPEGYAAKYIKKHIKEEY